MLEDIQSYPMLFAAFGWTPDKDRIDPASCVTQFLDTSARHQNIQIASSFDRGQGSYPQRIKKSITLRLGAVVEEVVEHHATSAK